MSDFEIKGVRQFFAWPTSGRIILRCGRCRVALQPQVPFDAPANGVIDIAIEPGALDGPCIDPRDGLAFEAHASIYTDIETR